MLNPSRIPLRQKSIGVSLTVMRGTWVPGFQPQRMVAHEERATYQTEEQDLFRHVANQISAEERPGH